MNLLLLVLLTLYDVFFWHYLHEVKGWNLGWELIYKGKPIYPLYRLTQGILDLLVIWFMIDFYPLNPLPEIWTALGFVCAWYFMLKEYLYYVFIWDWQGMIAYEKLNVDTYWLKRIYFSGFWILVPYKFWKFTLSALIGLSILLYTILR